MKKNYEQLLDEKIQKGELCSICNKQMKETSLPLFIGNHTATISYECEECGIEIKKSLKITRK